MVVKVFENPEAASHYAAWIFRMEARRKMEQKGHFTVALTGGSSPKKMYALLSEGDYANQVDWKNIHFFHGDERYVAYESDLSNARMADELLLNKVGADESHNHPMRTDIPVNESVADYTLKLKKLAPKGLDMAFLGMGSDGHTASLFPGTEILKEDTKWVGTSYNAEQETERISLTAPYLNKSELIVMLVFGKGKAETLYQVMEQEYKPEKLPVQLIRPFSKKLVWLTDKEAVSKLPKSFPLDYH